MKSFHSTQTWSLFKKYCENYDITSKNQKLCLDVTTLQNPTYMMLYKAENFQKAFQQLEYKNLVYIKTFGEDDNEDDDNNINGCDKRMTSKLAPLTKNDWFIYSRLFIKFHKFFQMQPCISWTRIMSLAIFFYGTNKYLRCN